MSRSSIRTAIVAGLLGALQSPLAAENGALKVTSFPSGAQVLVDGVSTGKVTPMSVSLPVGDHLVTVRIPDSGWRADTRTVTIVAGNNDLSVTLLPALTDGGPGPKGDKGDTGEKGDKGDKGDPGEPGAVFNFSAGDYIGCYTGLPGTRGVGICRGGTREFLGGAFGSCTGEIPPALETCNNEDDDCDGVVDDGLSCGNACVPTGETCNGVDDDCDGLIDEGNFCGGDPQTIQSIQDGSVAAGSAVNLEGVVVTSVAMTASGREFFVQEPTDTPAHPYPAFAGIAVFVPEASVQTFPDLAALQVGDCLNLGATVTEFQQGTQLVDVTSLTKVGGCGTVAPRVFDASNVCSIATDANGLLSGDQTGPSAEVFEGVLIRIENLRLGEQMGTVRLFTDPQPQGCSVAIDFSYFDGPFGGGLTSVTGVFNQRFSFRLFPRSAADFQ